MAVDASDEASLDAAVKEHDLVISLIPYTQHANVIKSAIKFKKHVVTTSYVSDAMKALEQEAVDAGITVLNEIGLDPGIDHLYAVDMIDRVHKEGGKARKFHGFFVSIMLILVVCHRSLDSSRTVEVSLLPSLRTTLSDTNSPGRLEVSFSLSSTLPNSTRRDNSSKSKAKISCLTPSPTTSTLLSYVIRSHFLRILHAIEFRKLTSFLSLF